MSCANNSFKCVESNDNQNNNNFREEKNNELNAEKTANDCNFWEVFTILTNLLVSDYSLICFEIKFNLNQISINSIESRLRRD